MEEHIDFDRIKEYRKIMETKEKTPKQRIESCLNRLSRRTLDGMKLDYADWVYYMDVILSAIEDFEEMPSRPMMRRIFRMNDIFKRHIGDKLDEEVFAEYPSHYTEICEELEDDYKPSRRYLSLLIGGAILADFFNLSSMNGKNYYLDDAHQMSTDFDMPMMTYAVMRAGLMPYDVYKPFNDDPDVCPYTFPTDFIEYDAAMNITDTKAYLEMKAFDMEVYADQIKELLAVYERHPNYQTEKGVDNLAWDVGHLLAMNWYQDNEPEKLLSLADDWLSETLTADKLFTQFIGNVGMIIFERAPHVDDKMDNLAACVKAFKAHYAFTDEVWQKLVDTALSMALGRSEEPLSRFLVETFAANVFSHEVVMPVRSITSRFENEQLDKPTDNVAQQNLKGFVI